MALATEIKQEKYSGFCYGNNVFVANTYFELPDKGTLYLDMTRRKTQKSN